MLLFTLTILSHSQAQIVGGNEEEDPEKPEKEEKAPKEKMNRDSLSGTTFYVTGLFNYGHRTFKDNTISGFYSDWENLKPDGAGGANFGVFLPVSKSLILDLGFTIFGHKEQYTYVSPASDSMFHYSNTYMQIGMPVRLRYTYGDKIQFFGYLGFTPLNVLNIRYKENYTQADGGTVTSEVRVIKDDKLTIFNVMATAGIGISYNFDWIGVTLYPEWRQYLFNTYNSQKSIDHKMYGLGVNMGVTLRF
jgi:hypothetical protein